jgi:hypothetical protein
MPVANSGNDVAVAKSVRPIQDDDMPVFSASMSPYLDRAYPAKVMMTKHRRNENHSSIIFTYIHTFYR